MQPQPPSAAGINAPPELARYFPGRGVDDVESALARLAGSDADMTAYLARYGDELRFHLATSPAFRAALMRRGPRAARRPTGAVQQHLARYASPELREALPPL
jgi:hypothetical protein